MSETACQRIRDEIEKSEFVLLGIGEEFSETQNVSGPEKSSKLLLNAYEQLEQLVNKKPYFVVTINEDERIFESKLLDFFIAAPYAKGSHSQSANEQWNAYLNWLAATLNHRLCILELGVGFSAPQTIRWPFEKTALFHWKSCLIRVNESFPQLPEQIGERGISIAENAVSLLTEGDWPSGNQGSAD